MKLPSAIPHASQFNIGLFVFLALLLASCGGGSNDSGSSGLAGQAQKGPFGIGSSIAVNELDSNLNPTGKVYNVQTTNNLGNFAVSSNIGTKLVEIVGTGYYMDELTGHLSTGQITLRAIVDLSVNTKPTLNVLTTLQEQRLKNLISQGQTYTAANAQSQTEVLAVFGIDSTKVNSLSTLYSMKINGSTDADSVLLATSTIFSQMASNAATANSTSQPTELSNYVNTIAAGLASTGTYTDSAFFSARNLAEKQVNFSTVRTNIETYYASRGVTMVAPKFEEWVDQSNSNVLPQRYVPVTGISFTNVTNAQPLQTVTSNTVTVSGLQSGVTVALAVNTGTIIIKNGTAVSGLYSTVTNGDTIALQVTTGVTWSSFASTLNAGSSTYGWNVFTVAPTIKLEYGLVPNSASPAVANSDTNDTATYFAYPIISSSSFVVSYIGVGIWPIVNNVVGAVGDTISIYNDNLGQPGTVIAAGVSGNYMASSTLADSGGNAYTLSTIGTEASFAGSGGVSLTANTPYWVVVQFPSALHGFTAWQVSCPNSLCSSFSMPLDPSPYTSKISNDGSSWTSSSGFSNSGPSNAYMPAIFLTN